MRARLQHRVQDAGGRSTRSTRRRAFRTSDHDPGMIGVQFAAAPTANAGGPVASRGWLGDAHRQRQRHQRAWTYAWDLDNDGTFERRPARRATFSTATIDGPATRQVRLRVTTVRCPLTRRRPCTVTNVAPTARLTAPLSVFAGFPFTVALTSPTDPVSRGGRRASRTRSTAAAVRSSPRAGPSATCPTSDTGTPTVRGRITDKDGGSTIYQANVSVRSHPPQACVTWRLRNTETKDGVANSLCAVRAGLLRRLRQRGGGAGR